MDPLRTSNGGRGQPVLHRAPVVRSLFLGALLVLSAAPGCASRGPLALQQRYPLVELARGVHVRPGTVAWSPDGGAIAYIRQGVVVHRIDTGMVSTIDLPAPLLLVWASASELHVISRGAGGAAVERIDTTTARRERIPLPGTPDMIWPVEDGRKLLALSVRHVERKLWSEQVHSLVLFDRATGMSSLLWEEQGIVPRGPAEDSLADAIRHAVPNAQDTVLLVPKPVKPPAFPFYMKLVAIDHTSGVKRELGRADEYSPGMAYSWSPDGRRFAFADAKARLRVFSVSQKGAGGAVAGDMLAGRFPSWNPRGSQIYFSGAVVNADGSGLERLLEGGADSIGAWSPDGTKLAVLAGDGLYLISGFVPKLLPPDRATDAGLRERLLLLKELKRDGLLGDREYDERYRRMME